MAAMGTSLQLWEPTVCDSVEELQQAMALLQNVDISQLPEAPKPPSLPQYDSAAADLPQQLQLVQRCIESMQYNHTGEKWFTLRKDRGISGVLSMGKRILEKALPIQCVEAVFLAVYLTQNAPGFPGLAVFPDDMLRMTLRFKSCVANNPKQSHRHIVLAVRSPQGKWGALGISRRSCLQDKSLVYASLAELVLEFALAYREVGHVLRKVYVGLPLPQGAPNHTTLQWRAAALRLPQRLFPPAELPLGGGARGGAWRQAAEALDAFEKALPALSSAWQSRGRITPTQRRAHRCNVQLPADTRLGEERLKEDAADGSSSDENVQVDDDSAAVEETQGAAHGARPEQLAASTHAAHDSQLELTLGGV